MTTHLRHHYRFYFAVAIGMLAFVVAGGRQPSLRVLFAGDAFFGAYLALMVGTASNMTPEGLRRRAAVEDEGGVVILILTAVAVLFSLGATFLIINAPNGGSAALALLAVLSVPLSWAMIHILAAFHYAKLFYAPARSRPGVAGGLAFPRTTEPGMLDFVYFAFVIGMTTQTSDVAIESHSMRRASLVHGIVSFFYNTVLIAISVNAAISIAGSAYSSGGGGW